MNPAGRIRICNMMPIARDYSRASHFYLRVSQERSMISSTPGTLVFCGLVGGYHENFLHGRTNC
jgi:hypothetical protein